MQIGRARVRSGAPTGEGEAWPEAVSAGTARYHNAASCANNKMLFCFPARTSYPIWSRSGAKSLSPSFYDNLPLSAFGVKEARQTSLTTICLRDGRVTIRTESRISSHSLDLKHQRLKGVGGRWVQARPRRSNSATEKRRHRRGDGRVPSRVERVFPLAYV